MTNSDDTTDPIQDPIVESTVPPTKDPMETQEAPKKKKSMSTPAAIAVLTLALLGLGFVGYQKFTNKPETEPVQNTGTIRENQYSPKIGQLQNQQDPIQFQKEDAPLENLPPILQMGTETPNDPNVPLITNENESVTNQEGVYDLPSGIDLIPPAPEDMTEAGSSPTPIVIETASENITQIEPKPKSENTVEEIDPRDIPLPNEQTSGPEGEFEETSRVMFRTLVAQMGDGKNNILRLKVPILYKSRLMRMTEEDVDNARKILEKTKEAQKLLEQAKVLIQEALPEWNELVRKTTPYEALLPESPSLPSNQSLDPLNRKENAKLDQGNDITFQIQN